jgi:hypothetical protein
MKKNLTKGELKKSNFCEVFITIYEAEFKERRTKKKKEVQRTQSHKTKESKHCLKA